MKTSAPKRKLAINRLRDRKPLDGSAVDRFLARHEVPIVEGSRCTFLYRGDADEVRLVQRVVGLPEQIQMRRLHGTDLWYVVLELPEGSRVNYQLEVRRGDEVERINDPRAETFTLATKLNLPTSYLLIHRTWLGALGLLSQLGAAVPFREIIEESLPGFAD